MPEFSRRLVRALDAYFYNRKMIQRTRKLENLLHRAAVGAASVDRLEVFKAQMITWAGHNPYNKEMRRNND